MAHAAGVPAFVTPTQKTSSSIRYHEPIAGPTDLPLVVDGVDESQSAHEIRDLPAVVVWELVVG